MPLYEYECQSCGKRIETLQRVNDPPLENCDCGEGGRLKKLVSAPAFQFKGDGWYVTDYARKDASGKDGAGKDKSKDASGKDTKSDSSGSETKTAKPSESTGAKSEKTSSATPPSSSSKNT